MRLWLHLMKGNTEATMIIERNKHNYDALSSKEFETYEKLKETNQVNLTEEKNRKNIV